jgi:hypothetical protein
LFCAHDKCIAVRKLWVAISRVFVGSCKSVGLGSFWYADRNVGHDVLWKRVILCFPDEINSIFTDSTQVSIPMLALGSVMVSVDSQDQQGWESSKWDSHVQDVNHVGASVCWGGIEHTDKHTIDRGAHSTYDVQKDTPVVLSGMIVPPLHWHPHIFMEKWELLEYFTLVLTAPSPRGGAPTIQS